MYVCVCRPVMTYFPETHSAASHRFSCLLTPLCTAPAHLYLHLYPALADVEDAPARSENSSVESAGRYSVSANAKQKPKGKGKSTKGKHDSDSDEGLSLH